MTDDRTETITDPAEIRATDEPDERGDFPCCTTPAPSSGAGLDLDALHETICDKFTGMAEVRQSADLLVAEVRRLVKFRDWWRALSLANAEDVRRLTAICHDWRDRSESAEAEVGTLRANWRHVTKSLGYGDGVTEPQIGHVEFVAECERQFSEASEWRESQRWRDECHDAGHPDDEDCYEHDPALVLLTLRAKVAAVEAHASRLAASLALTLYDAHPVYGSTALWYGGIGGQAITAHCAIINGGPPGMEWTESDLPSMALREFIAATPGFDLDAAKAAMLADLRAALATTGEGQ